MSKKALVFIMLFSFGLIILSLYIINTLNVESKPKPTSEIMNVSSVDIKVNEEFKLHYADGRDFTFDNLKNKFTVLYFGFVHCPDMCPETVSKMSQIIGMMNKKEINNLQFIFVSIDPKRDNRESLAKFTANFNKSIDAVTGEKEELVKLTNSLKAYYAEDRNSSARDDYYVDHSSFMYLLSPEAKLVSQFAPNALAEDIAKQIKIKMKD